MLLLSPEESRRGIVFGQLHHGLEYVFQPPPPCLEDFPHYVFLRDGWTAEPYGPNPYTRYLRASWKAMGREVTKRTVRAQVEKYLALVHRIEASGRQSSDLLPVVQTRTGQWALCDGNHRASVALHLGMPIQANVCSLENFIQKNIVGYIGNDFYGTGHRGRPYQSVRMNGELLINGRRDDLEERLSFVKDEDLAGRSVLDIGCNIGVSSFLAAERGASSVLGLDVNHRLLLGARRLNTVLRHPVRFMQADLSCKQDIGSFDTVFCFSVFAHVKNRKALIDTLASSTISALYLEGHAGTSLADYSFLTMQPFTAVEQVGVTADGTHTSSKTRPLFRATIDPSRPRAHGLLSNLVESSRI